jgi:hypothetical protein
MRACNGCKRCFDAGDLLDGLCSDCWRYVEECEAQAQVGTVSIEPCDRCGLGARNPEFYWCRECLSGPGIKAYANAFLAAFEPDREGK